jgi:hypothetical protein
MIHLGNKLGLKLINCSFENLKTWFGDILSAPGTMFFRFIYI